ncbi:unnamed protein product [Rotaria sordida]|uniref:Uncharacterized protein n=1 Tax=Rotaria sordida TaxID=392033 RepID=A0A814R864_9BILA|nr:unnamed protein product [Rotaria sordida]CAF1352638.1 unnamed protein product [Rotaria sordida]
MATSSVNSLVREVIVKPEFLDSLSLSLSDIEMTDVDKTPSNDTESSNGFDEDDFMKKKQHLPTDDENDKLDETDPRNIWRKRRKLSNNNQIKTTTEPHDHQLPIVIPVHHDYLMDMSNMLVIFKKINNQNPTSPIHSLTNQHTDHQSQSTTIT